MSKVSGIEESVDSVVSKEQLEVFASIVSVGDSNGGVRDGSGNIRVEEGSVESSSDITFSADFSGLGKCKVENKGEIFEFVLASSSSDVLVYIIVDNVWELSLDSSGDLVGDNRSDDWLDDVSNFVNTITLKINSDVILADDEINGPALECGHETSSGALLGGKIKSDGSFDSSDVDLGGSCDGYDHVRVGEVCSDVGDEVISIECDSVGGWVQREDEIFLLGWLVN